MMDATAIEMVAMTRMPSAPKIKFLSFNLVEFLENHSLTTTLASSIYSLERAIHFFKNNCSNASRSRSAISNHTD
jgi:hypothetical protein